LIKNPFGPIKHCAHLSRKHFMHVNRSLA